MLIGRKEEQKKLRRAFASDESEFVAVYGRRRVGKTYLIRETFGYKFTFTHTGLAKKDTRAQLQNFLDYCNITIFASIFLLTYNYHIIEH